MKIKIDKHGNLFISRRSEGGFKAQYCPFSDDVTHTCGDWCPLFSTYGDVRTDECGDNFNFRELRLCQKSYSNVVIEYEK